MGKDRTPSRTVVIVALFALIPSDFRKYPLEFGSGIVRFAGLFANEGDFTNYARSTTLKLLFAMMRALAGMMRENHGQIAYAAHDEFDDGCVVAYPPVSTDLLNQLVGKRVLHSSASGRGSVQQP